MSRPREPRSCSLFVIIPGPSRSGPDATPLAQALHHRLRSATIAVWTPAADVDLTTVERAAAVADDIQRRTGLRPRYVELSGDLGDAIADLVRRQHGPAVLTVASAAPRRIRTAVRRAAERCQAHLALVPETTHHHDRELI